jgi:hypothetical protein
VIVFHSFHEQPSVYGDHGGEAKAEHENESGIRASEIAPATASTVTFACPIRAAACLWSRLFGFENLHLLRRAPGNRVGLHY